MVLPVPQPGAQGEHISSVIASPGSAVSNNVAANVTSLLLSAGDWQISGSVVIVGTGTTAVAASPQACGASLVTGTLPATGDLTANIPLVITTTAVTLGIAIPTQRLILTVPTTVYLVVTPQFSAGSMTAYGRLDARRMR